VDGSALAEKFAQDIDVGTCGCNMLILILAVASSFYWKTGVEMRKEKLTNGSACVLTNSNKKKGRMKPNINDE
jgi:hypothetical protein